MRVTLQCVYLHHLHMHMNYCGAVTCILHLSAIFVFSYLHKFHGCVANQHRSQDVFYNFRAARQGWQAE